MRWSLNNIFPIPLNNTAGEQQSTTQLCSLHACYHLAIDSIIRNESFYSHLTAQALLHPHQVNLSWCWYARIDYAQRDQINLVSHRN